MKFSEYCKENGFGVKRIVELLKMIAESNIDCEAILEYQDECELSGNNLLNIIEIIEESTSNFHINSEEDIRKYIKKNGLTASARHFEMSVDELRTYHFHKKGIRAEEEERIAIIQEPAIDIFNDKIFD